MNQLRNTLSTLIAVALVLGGAYALGGLIARRAAYREEGQRNAARIKFIQVEAAHAQAEVERLEKDAALTELERRWMRGY